MATSRAIEAARAFVKIYAEDAPLREGLKRVVGVMSSTVGAVARTFGGIAKLAAGISLGNLISQGAAAVMDWSAAGAAIDDAAQRTGASAEGLSQLKFAAEQSGSSLGDVEKGMRKLADVTASAAAGNKTAAKSLDAVGLSAAALQGLSPEEQFLAVAEAISRVQDPARQTMLAMDLLGKSGANLLPMMQDGAAGIQAMMQEADALGLTLTTDQAAAAAGFDDAMGKLKSTLGTVAQVIGGAVLPYLTAMLETGLRLIPAVQQLASEVGQYLVQGFEYANQAMGGFLSGLGPLWQAVKDTFSGIANALAAGDIKAAAKLFWSTLVVEFQYGISAVQTEWAIWSKGFMDTFANAVTAVRRMWADTQNWLSRQIIGLWGMIDSSINVEAVQAEVDVMTQQQQQAITRDAAQAQAARDAKFEQRVTQATADLEAAKRAWADALQNANAAGERAANEPTAAAVADNKFTQLIRDLQAGEVATRIDKAVAGGGAQDIRSVAGVSAITSLLSPAGELNRQQIQILREVRDVQKRLLTVTERDRVGYVV